MGQNNILERAMRALRAQPDRKMQRGHQPVFAFSRSRGGKRPVSNSVTATHERLKGLRVPNTPHQLRIRQRPCYAALAKCCPQPTPRGPGGRWISGLRAEMCRGSRGPAHQASRKRCRFGVIYSYSCTYLILRVVYNPRAAVASAALRIVTGS